MDDSTNQLPGFFAPLLAGQYESAVAARILEGCTTRRAVTLRANRLVATRDEVICALDSAGVSWESVPWYEDAFILPEASERDIWNTEVYRSGKVYLQSLSSMIPPLVLSPSAGQDICDMCAAPGGKTTQMAALCDKAYITACEMHAPRAEKLEHNLLKLGARNVTVLRTDARKLDDFFSFDRILVDAPCSGSGTLDAHSPKTAKRFTRNLIDKSVKSQRALLAKAMQLVKPGGEIVYSTCSVLAEENDDVVEWALEHAPRKAGFELAAVKLASSDAIPRLPTRMAEALLVCPTALYEGFFVVRLKRQR